MPRYALKLEYDGSGFVGWQHQANGVSVQAVLEEAAARLEGAPVAASAAGRTDAGVHASGQVAHLDLTRDWTPATIRDALNFHIRPHRLVVLSACVVPPTWHARFTALGRAYRYTILNRPAPPALGGNLVWHVGRPLDIAAMGKAASTLLGRHDFTSFRAAACQAASPCRTLDRLEVQRRGDVVDIIAEARSFLHHQVRNMVGTLKLVGEGKWEVARVATALAARDRSQAGPTAPACGLTMTGVRYHPDPFMPPSSIGPESPNDHPSA